jgi:protein TonB
MGGSLAIVLGVAWSLATGLAQTLAEKVPELLKAEVLPEKVPDKTPPPPPPELKVPPPPFVPPPDFVIQSENAVVNTITTTTKLPPKTLPSSPASIGRPHVCQQDYPSISQRLGEEGTTEIAFTITADGDVTGLTVAKSSGSERLDSAAVSCASNWHYKPAILEGKPVSVSWKAAVRWVLH